MDLNLNLDANGGVDIYAGDATQQPRMKEVANIGTFPSEAPTRQECPPPKPNDVVQCMSVPPTTRMDRVNKGAAGTHPPTSQLNLKGKLSFKDEGESSHELIKNIRSTGPGSPWTFYTQECGH
ncbi:hypothetical protein S83_031693 [Arachis hypogaea]